MIRIMLRLNDGQTTVQKIVKSKKEAMHFVLILLPRVVEGYPLTAYIRRSEMLNMAYWWPGFGWVYAESA